MPQRLPRRSSRPAAPFRLRTTAGGRNRSSIGIALYQAMPRHETLIKIADAAMYGAKTQGGCFDFGSSFGASQMDMAEFPSRRPLSEIERTEHQGESGVAYWRTASSAPSGFAWSNTRPAMSRSLVLQGHILPASRASCTPIQDGRRFVCCSRMSSRSRRAERIAVPGGGHVRGGLTPSRHPRRAAPMRNSLAGPCTATSMNW